MHPSVKYKASTPLLCFGNRRKVEIGLQQLGRRDPCPSAGNVARFGCRRRVQVPELRAPPNTNTIVIITSIFLFSKVNTIATCQRDFDSIAATATEQKAARGWYRY